MPRNKNKKQVKRGADKLVSSANAGDVFLRGVELDALKSLKRSGVIKPTFGQLRGREKAIAIQKVNESKQAINSLIKQGRLNQGRVSSSHSKMIAVEVERLRKVKVVARKILVKKGNKQPTDSEIQGELRRLERARLELLKYKLI